MTVGTDAGTIVCEIEIRAPLARVYAALTDPKQLTDWWGGGAYRCETMEADFRVGGKWQTTGRDKDGKSFAVGGEYRVVDAPHVVEMTWRHDWGAHESDEETVVRYELSERDGLTRLRVVHSGFTDLKDRDDHNNGWVQVLAWLKNYVEG